MPPDLTGDTMNLAYQARTAVGLYLDTQCTQEDFAQLMGVPVEEVKKWETKRGYRGESGTCSLLKSITRDTEFTLVALVDVRIRLDFGLELPEDIVFKLVQVCMKKNGLKMSGKACFRLMWTVKRAQLASDAGRREEGGSVCLF